MSRPGAAPPSTFEAEVRAAARLDFRARRRTEQRLARSAGGELPALRRLLDADDVAVRRMAVELLRRGAPSEPELRAWILERLDREPDVKTRRRLCVAAGESGDPALCDALLERLEAEPHRYVQASLVLALGRLGFARWPDTYRRRSGEGGPVGEALRLALGRGGPPAPSPPRPQGSYLLRLYPGAEPLARLEWERAGLGPGRLLAPGWVEVSARGDPGVESLAGLRAVLADFHVAWRGDAARALEAGVAAVLERAGPGHSFRLTLPRERTRHAYRARVRAASRAAQAVSGWRNDPSDYDLDLRLERFGSETAFAWRSRDWPGPARARRRALPASIHPSVAAALCHAALARRVDPEGRTPLVLVDPCCGAGTIALEWRAVAPRGVAFGLDRSARALARARRNARRVDRVAWARARVEALPLASATADAAIANPPFGLRVGRRSRNDRLYEALLRETRRVLRPGAPLVVYTGAPAALERAASRLGLELEPVATIQAGGLEVEVFAVGDSRARARDTAPFTPASASAGSAAATPSAT